MFFAVIIFLSAGRINYFQAWLFWGTTAFTAFLNYWTIRNNEALMTEHSHVGDDAKQWDKIILGVSALLYVVTMILAGLDTGR